MTGTFDRMTEYLATCDEAEGSSEPNLVTVLDRGLTEIEAGLQVASTAIQVQELRQQLSLTEQFLLHLASQKKFESSDIVVTRIELAKDRLYSLEESFSRQVPAPAPPPAPARKRISGRSVRSMFWWVVVVALATAFARGPGTLWYRYWFVWGVDLRSRTVSCEELRKMPDLYRAKLDSAVITGDNCNLSGRELSGSSWRGTVIPRGLNLSRSNLQDSVFVKVKAEGIDLSLTQLNGAFFHVVEFPHAKLNGVVGNCSVWRVVDLTEADLSYSSFGSQNASNSNLDSCSRMEDVTLSGAKLSAADMKGLSFKRVKLDDTTTSGAQLPGG